MYVLICIQYNPLFLLYSSEFWQMHRVTTNQDTEQLHHPQDFSPVISHNQLLPHHDPLANTDLFSIPIVCLFQNVLQI